MITRMKNRCLTIGFWGTWIVTIISGSSGSWVVALCGLVVMVVLDQYQEED